MLPSHRTLECAGAAGLAARPHERACLQPDAHIVPRMGKGAARVQLSDVWAEQSAELAACPIVLAQRAASSTLHCDPFRRAWSRVLGGRRIALMGDSMARQSFYSLVGQLRGQSAIVDYEGWSHATYQRVEEDGWVRDGLTLGAIGLGPMPPWAPAAEPRWAERLASLDVGEPQHPKVASRRERFPPRFAEAADRRPPRSSAIAIDFFFSPCPWSLDRRGGRVVEMGYTDVIIFAPAFWEVQSSCSSSCGVLLEDRNRSRAGMHPSLVGHEVRRDMALSERINGESGLECDPASTIGSDAPGSTWAELKRRSQPAVNYIVVTTPVEHVPERRGRPGSRHAAPRAEVTMRNGNLSALFLRGGARGRGAFPSNWQLADFASLTRLTKPVGLRDNWHYACAYDKPLGGRWSWGVQANLTVDVRRTGDCAEEANRALWQQLLIPMLDRPRRASAGPPRGHHGHRDELS